MALITLTTDFGTRDPYVGAMKGAILAVAAELTLVDLSHDVAPQDVLGGSYVLRQATAVFPARTVHLGVVDPGVGSDRRALAIDDGRHLWVGPDNGLFTHVLEQTDARAYELQNHRLRRPTVSPTFHGRDLFAPAAAHLACGFDITAVGPPVFDALRLPQAGCQRLGQALYGHILHVDHFGNLVTTIDATQLAHLMPVGQILVGEARIEGLVTTYSDVARGELAALVGSGGLLEICRRDGSAARHLGLECGVDVVVYAAGEPSP